jgi:signal transduction histidine kinase
VTPRAEALAPLVRDVVRTFEPLAEGVRFRLELAEDVTVLGDAAALRQVLINLLDNAVKYGPPDQVVTVGVLVQQAASASAGGVARARLGVEDEGTGIPAESRGRVFVPYVRLVRHQGAARGGSGIGLSVVRELVALHGGATWVEPAPGGGARFVGTLPLAESTPLERAPATSLGGPLAHEHHGARSPSSTALGAGTPQQQVGPEDANLHHPEPAARSTSAPGAGALPPSGATA